MTFNLNVVGKVIPSSSEVKLLRITIDYELKFKKHINELCRKASCSTENKEIFIS